MQTKKDKAIALLDEFIDLHSDLKCLELISELLENIDDYEVYEAADYYKETMMRILGLLAHPDVAAIYQKMFPTPLCGNQASQYLLYLINFFEMLGTDIPEAEIHKFRIEGYGKEQTINRILERYSRELTNAKHRLAETTL